MESTFASPIGKTKKLKSRSSEEEEIEFESEPTTPIRSTYRRSSAAPSTSVPQVNSTFLSDSPVAPTLLNSPLINYPPISAACPSTSPEADLSVNRLPSPPVRHAIDMLRTESPGVLNPQMINITRGSSAPVLLLTVNSTQAEVRQVIINLSSNTHMSGSDHFTQCLDPAFHIKFRQLLQNCYPQSEEERNSCMHWREWTKDKFLVHLPLVFPDRVHSNEVSFVQRITSVKFVYDLEDDSVNDIFTGNLEAVLENFPGRSLEEEAEAVKVLFRHFSPTSEVPWRAIFSRVQLNCALPSPLTTVGQWMFVWIQTLLYSSKAVRSVEELGFVVSGSSNTRSALVSKITKTASASDRNTKTEQSTLCSGCGKPNHVKSQCRLKNHKYFNNTDSAFIKSKKYDRMVKEVGVYPSIPNDHTLSVRKKSLEEEPSKSSSSSSSSSSSTPTTKPSNKRLHGKDQEKNKKQKGELITSLKSSITTSSDLISVSLLPLSKKQVPATRNEVQALLDTGNLAGDFIAQRVVDNFKLHPFIFTSNSKRICSGLDNQCYDTNMYINLQVTFFNELLIKNDIFEINGILLKNTPFDLIIGRETIQKCNLFTKIPSQLLLIAPQNSEDLKSIECVNKPCGCQSKGASRPPTDGYKGLPFLSQRKNPTVPQTRGLVATLILKAEQLLGMPTPDEDEINQEKNDVFAPWLPHTNTPDVLTQIHISGTEELQFNLRTLCTEFKDIFSNELPAEPAKVPPFELIVDTVKWRVSRNRGPPRQQSPNKQAELIKTINTLKSQGLQSSPYGP